MKKIYKLFLVVLSLTGLTSCLDEDPVFDGMNAPNVIEIQYAGTGSNSAPLTAPFAVYLNSLPIDEAKPVELPVYINYAGAGVAPEDITVNLALDPAALTKYNSSVGSSYELLPESVYEIPSFTVTIPKGERRAILPINVRTNQINLTKQYALGLTITGASSGTVSANFKTAILRIGAKNEYEGTYKNTYTSSLGNGINTVKLSTTGPRTVTMNLIGVYSNQVVLDVDPATKKVTVSMTTLLPIATDPSSYYDPATQTYHLKWTSNGGVRTFNQTLVRTGD